MSTSPASSNISSYAKQDTLIASTTATPAKTNTNANATKPTVNTSGQVIGAIINVTA